MLIVKYHTSLKLIITIKSNYCKEMCPQADIQIYRTIIKLSNISFKFKVALYRLYMLGAAVFTLKFVGQR